MTDKMLMIYRYSVAPTALFQPVADESVLLDLASEKYFSLDAVGTRMWQLIAEHGELDVVVAKMLEEYDAPEDLLRRDVVGLAQKLTDAGLLVREKQAGSA